MSLRPLLDLARGDGRFLALADAAREGGAVPVYMSGAIQPYLLAALAEAEEGFGGRPVLVVAADDIGARDLARELRAYLARRVRYYPSRGTGYASHLAPPPHLSAFGSPRWMRSRPPSLRSSWRARSPLPRPSGRLASPGGLRPRRGAEVDLRRGRRPPGRGRL